MPPEGIVWRAYIPWKSYLDVQAEVHSSNTYLPEQLPDGGLRWRCFELHPCESGKDIVVLATRPDGAGYFAKALPAP